MANTKSLYELKQEGKRKKNPNTLTDADYYLRDKVTEAKNGYPNSHDMTPPPPKQEAEKASKTKGE
jgi:hypothetical protein